MIYKTLHRKLKVEQHERHQKKEKHVFILSLNLIFINAWKWKCAFVYVRQGNITFNIVLKEWYFTSGTRTAYTSGTPEFTHVFLGGLFGGVRVAQPLVFCVVFCRSLFFLLSIFFWPLHCLSLFDFDLWDMVTPLISSIVSHMQC